MEILTIVPTMLLFEVSSMKKSLSLACNWLKPETMSELFKNYNSQHDRGQKVNLNC